ncbi:rRNA-processing protein bfr2 [Malassezia psittaci]|uniref:Protein BFR2 n=1 Tax=Malassezia psittaci TaxID=1821823 RepID=A0AAF0F8N4_9BASI|nr:rRNA-processing protein bfr2 [Malassezia psittaci]
MALDLDSLLQVAPESFDPENIEADHDGLNESDSGSDDQQDVASKRRHYVDMDKSQMRKTRLTDSNALDSGKYKATRTSRAEMFGDDNFENMSQDSDHDEDDDEDGLDALHHRGEQDSNDSQLTDEIDSDDQISEVEDFDDDEELSGEDSSPSQQEEFDDGDESESEASQESESENASSNSAAIKDGSITKSQGKKRKGLQHDGDQPSGSQASSDDLIAQLHSRQKQDAEKGKQVQKQVRSWEQALRTRIAMQKVSTQVNRLPSSSELQSCLEGAPNLLADLDQAAAELEGMADKLLSIRSRLWPKNVKASERDIAAKINLEASGPKVLRDLEQTIEPYRRALLARWSDKIAAAPDSKSTLGGKLQLRAMNQGIVQQLDQAMNSDTLSQLVERTQVWRSPDANRISTSSSSSSDPSSERDVDVFDDSDFYAQLLRDLVENAALTQTGTSAYATDALQAKKRKRAVDVRASKGRRIRYQVIEKAQNFMPPIPRVTWSDEQAQRLFIRLAGAQPDQDDEEPMQDASVGDTLGFRLVA